jgi:hypothetical protein
VESLAKAAPDVVGIRLYVEHANANAQRSYAALGMQDEGYKVYFARTDEG